MRRKLSGENFSLLFFVAVLLIGLAAARRIQEGNLEEDIVYQGEEEFEHVCRTFNAMQKTMREDREQRAKNEKARIDMVTGISHDLRTPLTSVQGYIKGVLDGVASTEEKRRCI